MTRPLTTAWAIPLTITLLVVLAGLLPAFPQPASYHAFTDGRSLFGLPNALNVLSNLAFLIPGILGMMALLRNPRSDASPTRWAYGTFFGALLVLTLVSGWYHLSPDNDRLLWDRLAIAIGFAALLSALLGESHPPNPWILPWMLTIGGGSVLWWGASPMLGEENLLPYLVFQGGSLLGLLAVMRSAHQKRRLQAVLLLYAGAVGAEWLDAAIFSLTHAWISGHTLKHLLAAGAALAVVPVIKDSRRERNP